MATGRVVVVKEHQQPFVIEEYPVPDPEPGGIVLRITQAGSAAPTCTPGAAT